MLSNAPAINLQFRRNLIGANWVAWLNIVQRLMSVSLTTKVDVFKWKLTMNGVFTVGSMYDDYMNDHTPFLRKYLWKLRIPLKIIFYVVC